MLAILLSYTIFAAHMVLRTKYSELDYVIATVVAITYPFIALTMVESS
jgi:hypothetical protein